MSISPKIEKITDFSFASSFDCYENLNYVPVLKKKRPRSKIIDEIQDHVILRHLLTEEQDDRLYYIAKGSYAPEATILGRYYDIQNYCIVKNIKNYRNDNTNNETQKQMIELLLQKERLLQQASDSDNESDYSLKRIKYI